MAQLTSILQFRTFYPLMALHSPADFADIVNNYIDGWRQTGWMPECRSNNLPGWSQGGEHQHLKPLAYVKADYGLSKGLTGTILYLISLSTIITKLPLLV